MSSRHRDSGLRGRSSATERIATTGPPVVRSGLSCFPPATPRDPYDGPVNRSPAADLPSYALDLGTRERPGFTVRVEACTWDIVVFRVAPAGDGRSVVVARAADEVRGFLRDLDAGRLDSELGRALRRPPRRLLTRPPRRPTTLRAGVEHEYRVLSDRGPVDARAIIDDLDLGPRVDPTDPHAHRGPWGGVITADGAEAEVATPPVLLGPGAVATVAALAHRGRAVLDDALGDDRWLEGYSTHLNVSAPRRGDRRVATRFARVFAAPLMLLLDRSTSPGLLVRPRPGRLELGGEFADSTELEVALTFAIGAALASRSARPLRGLALDVDLEPARERYGWYVDRRAFGADLYTLGRSTPLRLSGSGATILAGRHLEVTWSAARPRLVGLLGADELALVDAVVGSSEPLPRPSQDGVAS